MNDNKIYDDDTSFNNFYFHVNRYMTDLQNLILKYYKTTAGSKEQKNILNELLYIAPIGFDHFKFVCFTALQYHYDEKNDYKLPDDLTEIIFEDKQIHYGTQFRNIYDNLLIIFNENEENPNVKKVLEKLQSIFQRFFDSHLELTVCLKCKKPINGYNNTQKF